LEQNLDRKAGASGTAYIDALHTETILFHSLHALPLTELFDPDHRCDAFHVNSRIWETGRV
jgi:hypothetical protein